MYDRDAAIAELTTLETSLRTLLEVYGQRLERESSGTNGSVEVPTTDRQAATAAAALPELQHHAAAFLASAKALDDQFITIQATGGGDPAAAIRQEIDHLKAELAEKDALLSKQGDNLVKWQMVFAKLAADATVMADDPEA